MDALRAVRARPRAPPSTSSLRRGSSSSLRGCALRLRALFRVPVDFEQRSGPRECIFVSKNIYSLDDPMHKAKNAELAFEEKLGKYVVHPTAFRDKARKVAQARNMRQLLFSFSRLFQDGLHLQTFIRHVRPPFENLMPQVARNNALRLF